jgi:HAD superfamily hydrolase (TIGR01509 family)
VARPRISARAVLFDWDGTLLDSYRADARAYLEMFHAMGIGWGLEDLALHYSPNWYRVYQAAGLPRSRWKEADRRWQRAYRNESPKLLTGAGRVLRQLRRDYVLGLVTSGNGRRVRRQLREFRLLALFSTCVCCEDAPHRKPHPAPLQLALRRLQLAPSDCVYVGDAPEDVEMARRAGVSAIGVRGPFPTADRVRAARPDALLKTIADLPEYLRAIPSPQGGKGLRSKLEH